MIEIRPTEDLDLVRTIMTHPKVWPYISDDFCGEADSFEPVLSPALLYLEALDEEGPGGVWLYHPHNAICWEVHTCCLPEWWGPRALQAARLTLRWVVEHTACRKVITYVPVCNSLAYRFALRAGMVDEGRNRASFLKRGQVLDQYVLGITREEISCLPLPS
jgi:RimJ/RimL family protein N-acetyltransferase